jgi:hypothetical protein
MYYGMDLRERVIKAADAGMLRKDVSKQFSVGLKTPSASTVGSGCTLLGNDSNILY